MFHSLVSRPAVQRFISRPGPLVLYPLLAAFFGWCAVALPSVVCGWLALGLFGPIAAGEWHACITGRGFY